MKIFLTGGRGFIGKSFIKEAIKKNFFIYSISRKNKNKKTKQVQYIKGDLGDNWFSILKKSDVVVHLAASGVQGDDRNIEDIFNTNIIKSYKMIHNAINNGCKKFVIATTSSEYGKNSLNLKKITKHDARIPVSNYGLSKAIFTDLIKNLSKNKNCKFRMMRLFPIHGKGESSHRLFPSLKKAAKTGKNFTVKTPSELRDFTDVDYASKVLIDSCSFKKHSKKFEIFHVSSSKPLTVAEFAKKIWKKYNAKGRLLYKNRKKIYTKHVSNLSSNWNLKYEKK